MATWQENLARKQIYIPASQPEEAVALKVAAYCRVSTDSDDQLNSFAAQHTHYKSMIMNHEKWEMVEIYSDEGITGTSAEKRDDFQRMLYDCRKGRIDKILVKSISRFARNTKECLEILRDLHLRGVSVFFEEYNLDSPTNPARLPIFFSKEFLMENAFGTFSGFEPDEWSNDACRGYVIMAMEDCGFSKKDIRRVVGQLYEVFDGPLICLCNIISNRVRITMKCEKFVMVSSECT